MQGNSPKQKLKNEDKPSVAKNIRALYLLHAANYLIPLIVFPYLIRVLGTENFGRLIFAQAFIMYFMVLCDYGFNLSATRRISQIREDPDAFSRLVFSVFISKASLAVAGFVLMISTILLIPVWRPNLPLFLVTYLSVFGTALFPVWLFQGLEKMSTITVVTVISRILSVIGIFLFVRHQDDVLFAAGFQSGAGLISGIISLTLLPSLIRKPKKFPTIADILETLRDGWPIFISDLAVNLYTSTNVFLLGILTNPTVVGQFGAGEKLVRATARLITPISRAYFPHVAKTTKANKDAALAVIRKLIIVQGALTLFFSAILAIFAGPLTQLLFGAEMKQTALIVLLLSPLPLLTGLSNVLGIQTMLNFGLTRQFSRILVTTGVVNVALVLLLVPIMSGYGAAIGIIVTEAIVTLAMLYVLWRAGILRELAVARA